MSTFTKSSLLLMASLFAGSVASASEYAGVGFGPNAMARHPVVDLQLLSSLRGFDPNGACGFLIPPAGKSVGAFHIYRQTKCTSSTPKFVNAERVFHGGLTFSDFKQKSEKDRGLITSDIFDKSLKIYLNERESGTLVDLALHIDRLADGIPGIKADAPDVVYAVYQLPNFGKMMKVAVGEVIGSVQSGSGFKLLSLCQFVAKSSSSYGNSCTLSVSSKGSLDISMRQHTREELAEGESGSPRR